MGNDLTKTNSTNSWIVGEAKDGKTCFYFGKGSIFRLLCSKNTSDRPIKWLLLKHPPRKKIKKKKICMRTPSLIKRQMNT
jgi:hypothetical protein